MSDDTPKVNRNITPKNLLDALLGEKKEVDSVAAQKLAKEKVLAEKAMAQKLEKAIDRRDLAVEKMLRINEGLKKADKNIHWLNLQLENLRRCNEDLERSFAEICELVPKDKRKPFKDDNIRNEEVYDELHVMIQTEIAKLKEAEAEKERAKLNVLAPPFNPNPQQPVVVNSAPHLHVPLPTFDGNLENWYSFKCMFQTIMNRYPNESPAIKLYHLKNALVGSAASKIDQDVINNNDYSAAWKMLEDAYEDERLIIDTHVDALLSLPKMTSENGEELRKLIDACTKHVDALKGRQLPVTGLGEVILVNVIAKRLDKETRKLWESQLDQDEMPSYTELMVFLRERTRILQKLTGYGDPRMLNLKQRKPEPRSLPARNFLQTSEFCHFCRKEDHLIYKCGQFEALDVSEKYAEAKQNGLCFNCLRPGHITRKCESDKTCRTCKRRHHSLLHEDKSGELNQTDNESEQPTKPIDRQEAAVQAGSVNCATSLMVKQQVILSTAEVVVLGAGDTRFPCRVLLDSGSDSNLILESFAKKLNLPLDNINLPISSLNNAETHVKHKLRAKVLSRVSSFGTTLDFLIVPKITNELPGLKLDVRSWSIPAGLALADPGFYVPNEIQMIIGAELFYDLVKNGRIKLAGGNPTLVETDLGWVISGPVKSHCSGSHRSVCQLNCLCEERLNHTLTKFWELETVQEASPLTTKEQAIENHFLQTYSRDEAGRYTVRLPFNENKSQLGDSLVSARSRFNRLLRSFVNKTKQARYSEFMAEYQAMGHMVEVTNNPDDGYFLPHHAVYKESSTTTKIRVVFDASAKTTTGVSLNDTLGIGPTVQRDLISILLRFCCFPVVLTADIPKMYRQVKVHEDDRKYQRILWLNAKNEVATFELTTVTYGCASAPYLATRVLMQLAKDEALELPIAAKVIEENSYIDDFLTGGSTDNEVIEIYKQLTEILQRGGFGVHKFCTNSEAVRNIIPDELLEKQVDFQEADINNAIKTLGLIWNPYEDYFCFNVARLDGSVPTKKSVLSAIGLLFDPCGFLGPVVTVAKLLMQDLWRLKLKWDDVLPDEQMRLWIEFRGQLPLVNQLKKKRCVVRGDATRVELHGFSDASMRAYGAAVYTRCFLADGTSEVELVDSKSRVAPLKPTSIPRLECCGTLLLAELLNKTIEAMQIPFSSVTLHIDSQVVLCWLEKSPLALNQFVANRIARILELTPNCKREFVRSEHNPADYISRGVLPAEFVTLTEWRNPRKWEKVPHPNAERIKLDDDELPELKPQLVVATVQQVPSVDFSRVSIFRRLQRAWAYVLRFIKNTRTKTRDTSEFKAQELVEAHRVIMMLVQKEEFKDLSHTLETDVTKRTVYSALAPFIGEDGLIRVGGRLKYSAIPYDGKHQILLPEKHHVTIILTRQLHKDNLHVGQRGLLSIVREKYWPVHAGLLMKRVVTRCVICRKQNAQSVNQFMGDLPDYRVTPAPVFANTGVDYAGPIFLKEAGRKTTVYKAYICVFVCMATVVTACISQT